MIRILKFYSHAIWQNILDEFKQEFTPTVWQMNGRDTEQFSTMG